MLLIPLSIVVAVSFALPLFLGLRELHLARQNRLPTGPGYATGAQH